MISKKVRTIQEAYANDPNVEIYFVTHFSHGKIVIKKGILIYHQWKKFHKLINDKSIEDYTIVCEGNVFKKALNFLIYYDVIEGEL